MNFAAEILKHTHIQKQYITLKLYYSLRQNYPVGSNLNREQNYAKHIKEKLLKMSETIDNSYCLRRPKMKYVHGQDFGPRSSPPPGLNLAREPPATVSH